MKRFEYSLRHFRLDGTSLDYTEMGLDGWRAVSLQLDPKDPNVFYVLYERPISKRQAKKLKECIVFNEGLPSPFSEEQLKSLKL